ncbi:MAG: ATP synthase F1 subunit gamma [Chloroflexi bacterium]|nr:ATP synthase F1 subunit gamma [Chloroflexota bacterium]
MPSTREIRRRIRSVTSTGQITKAMEMVAASKMRRAQVMALATRPYADKMREALSSLTAQTQGTETLHPLLTRRPVKNICLVLMTADRGLAGGLNTNMIRYAASFILERSEPVHLVTVGRRGRDWMVRRSRHILAEFTQLGDRPSLNDTTPISRVVMDSYLSEECDEVHVAYTHFQSTLVQRPTSFRLLPIEPPAEPIGRYLEFIYEPSAEEVLAQLLPRYVDMEVYHAVLEAVASEQSARMVAMRNATENAKEIVNELTLRYNKARQEGITKELLEIASGAQALG